MTATPSRRSLATAAVGLALVIVVGAAAAVAAGVALPGLVGPTGGDAAAPFGVEPVGDDVGFDYRAVQYEGVARGGGVYVTDYDRDGWPDVLAVGGTPGDGRARPTLFENDGGEFAPSGALPDGLGRETVAALFFDYDNDGWEDLLLLRLRAPPVFLENDGGEFVRRDAGFESALTEPTGAAAADYDGDGCLDVFVIQNGDWTERTPVAHGSPNMTVEDDNGEPNYLFRGSCGEGGFERVTDAGLGGTRWSLATSFVDLTGDGRPDIHVANDYNNDYVYVNEGDGTFAAVELGPRTNRNGMSSEVFDANGDGLPDIFVTNIYIDTANVSSEPIRNYLRYRLGKRADGGNNLLINRGNGTFVDRSDAYGVRKGGWGWAAVATDFDNDGDVDLFHATQRIGSGRADGAPAYLQTPAFYERTGPGRFERRNGSRLGFVPADGLGAARLDYDRDGDQDILVGQTDRGSFLLYENTAAGNGWLQVRAREPSGRPAYGVRVTVTAGDRTTARIQTSMADFASQDARTLQFGLGGATNATVVATWPDGTTVRAEVAADRRLHVYRNGTVVRAPPEGSE